MVAIFVLSLMIPAAFRLSRSRTPHTALLIVFFIPLIQTFLRDRTNRLVPLDICMLAHVAWVAIAVIHAEGHRAHRLHRQYRDLADRRLH